MFWSPRLSLHNITQTCNNVFLDRCIIPFNVVKRMITLDISFRCTICALLLTMEYQDKVLCTYKIQFVRTSMWKHVEQPPNSTSFYYAPSPKPVYDCVGWLVMAAKRSLYYWFNILRCSEDMKSIILLLIRLHFVAGLQRIRPTLKHIYSHD